MDDDCQTDSEQIKLAVNKSKNQVVNSLKRIKKEKLIYDLIHATGNDQDENSESELENDSFYFSSQGTGESQKSSSSCGLKFSKESRFL